MGEGRKEILILDQDENVLIDLERLLQNEGFDTTTTSAVAEALDLLAVKQFDCFLLGDHLPEVDRSELLKGLASRQSVPVSIVMQTRAAADRSTLELLSRLGTYAVVPKWNHRELLAKVKECVHTTDKHLPRQATAA